jgi:hypothetical protein
MPVLGSILPRRGPGVFVEGVGEMALIGKSDHQGRLGQGGAAPKQMLGSLDASQGAKQVRRQSGFAFEHTQEMITAQAGDLGNRFERQFTVQIFREEFHGATHGCYSSPPEGTDRCCRAAKGDHDGRFLFQPPTGSLKGVKSALDSY